MSGIILDEVVSLRREVRATRELAAEPAPAPRTREQRDVVRNVVARLEMIEARLEAIETSLKGRHA